MRRAPPIIRSVTFWYLPAVCGRFWPLRFTGPLVALGSILNWCKLTRSQKTQRLPLLPTTFQSLLFLLRFTVPHGKSFGFFLGYHEGQEVESYSRSHKGHKCNSVVSLFQHLQPLSLTLLAKSWFLSLWEHVPFSVLHFRGNSCPGTGF